ncbi:hypothetical protein JXM83_05040 [Candidatus Woesearchaeota archaeon]|nr:hypothetical protein [Candidatus Woesearchaeota archaeon]
MDQAAYYVIRVLKDELGSMGPVLLKRLLDRLGYNSINTLSETQKENLIRNILDYICGDYSNSKKGVLESKLRTKINYYDPDFDENKAIAELMA